MAHALPLARIAGVTVRLYLRYLLPIAASLAGTSEQHPNNSPNNRPNNEPNNTPNNALNNTPSNAAPGTDEKFAKSCISNHFQRMR
jgi:hypothetical protein